MNSIYREIKALLTEGGMPEGEARAVALMLLEKVAGLPTAKALIADGNDLLCRRQTLLELAARVAQGEPVQYVLGEADFCGLTMKVKPGVLIPRPETEELVNWIVETLHTKQSVVNCQLSTVNCQLLDIGTGSGCIAVALAKKLEQAEVEAWDVNEVALEVTKENAEKNGVKVKVNKVDVLSPHTSHLTPLTSHLSPLTPYDVIVSNPPYICEEEREEMEKNVLEHEPELALFVPNHDPLLFYRQIAELGLTMLKEKGLLFFEINRRFGEEVVKMLQEKGYQEVELRQDLFGNDRMVKAIKPA
ncbi:MAG: peptide chain release factor N(5)-glutamine methyltransferase [Bacteroidaceae bacterium]|nr:peptide chain release factor N(5)-glutamine methyltransferase [Bacteroidaceae bacterium]